MSEGLKYGEKTDIIRAYVASVPSGGLFTTDDVWKQLLTSYSSVTVTLTKLLRQGTIKRVRRGVYRKS